MPSKEFCSIQRAIRAELARMNDIPFSPEPCPGIECNGTCAVCEREMQYIESAIEAREKAGNALRIHLPSGHNDDDIYAGAYEQADYDEYGEDYGKSVIRLP